MLYKDLEVINLQKIIRVLKYRTPIFIVLTCLLFVITSCGSRKYIRTVDSFLSDLKSRNISKSYTYLIEDDESNMFKDYMKIVLNLQDTEGEFASLSDLVLEKIFDFEYEIFQEEENDEFVDVNVKFKYFDFSNVYIDALSDFLERSLDFENLDNLYSGDYIKNILMEYISKAPRKEIELKISVTKSSELKIKLSEDTVEILTGNFINFFTSVNKNILGEQP